MFFASLLIFYGILSTRGFNLASELEEGFRQTLELQMDILRESGLTRYEILEERDTLISTYETALMRLPSTLIISVFIWSYINYLLTSHGLRKVGISILNMPGFSFLKLPDNFSIGALVMLFTAFIMTRMNISYADAILDNIVLLLGVVLFVQGLSVVNFFLIKFKTKKYIRVLTYIILLFTPNMFSGISILGGIDVVLDVRKIKRPRS